MCVTLKHMSEFWLSSVKVYIAKNKTETEILKPAHPCDHYYTFKIPLNWEF